MSMSAETTHLPVTPVKQAAVATQNGGPDAHRKLKESSSQKDFREAPDKIEVPGTQPLQSIKELPATQSDPGLGEHGAGPNLDSSERVPRQHALGPFDWDDIQFRYDQAMTEARAKEETLLGEFNELAKYFGIWAATASKYDEQRALKRLRTRKAYIQNAEESLEVKKRQYSQVVDAFKNALALLSEP